MNGIRDMPAALTCCWQQVPFATQVQGFYDSISRLACGPTAILNDDDHFHRIKLCSPQIGTDYKYIEQRIIAY